MIKYLERKYPLDGRGNNLVNWGTIVTTVVGTVLAATVWSGWERAVAVYQLPEKVQYMEEALNHTLPQILDEMRQIAKHLSVSTGTVLVTHNGGSGESCIWINIYGPASRYIHEGELRATNMEIESRRTAHLTIKGAVENPDTTVLGEIGQNAARSLSAGSKSELIIKLEPIPKHPVPGGVVR